MPEPVPASPPLLRLDLTEPQRHLVGVNLRFTPSTDRLRLRLPAWTPGSYLIRDYVRNLEGLEAWQGDQCLALGGSAPEGWSLKLNRMDPVEIRYRILATELTVRTCHLTGDHGFFALAGVALQLEAERWNQHRIELRLPPGWEAFIPLPRDERGRWVADNFDQLIDTPVEVGPHPCHTFSVAGVPHRWVSWGGDLPRMDGAWLEDVERVCLTCCRLMGEQAPAACQYLFILHLTEKGFGGLEHDFGTVLQFGRRAWAEPDGRRRLLQLVAHEYLHQWNVRRLRPAELTPIDYDRPMVVPSLWFAEGVTSYADQLIPFAAGIVSEASVLEDLGKDLSRFLLTPGRRVQSLRQSSQEAWVKLYRKDAYSADNQISYYLKGAVLAMVLDLHLRRHNACLSLVLQDLWASHGRWGKGYLEVDLLAAFQRHSPDLSTLLPVWLNSTDDPPIHSYLADVGLRLVPESCRNPSMGWQIEEDASGDVLLKRVERDGPAQRAGLQVGDELLAFDAQRIRSPQDLDPPRGDRIPVPEAHDVLFCRDGIVRHASIQPDPPTIQAWRLEIDPAAGDRHRELRRRWLSLQP